jgi:hypothetical protein
VFSNLLISSDKLLFFQMLLSPHSVTQFPPPQASQHASSPCLVAESADTSHATARCASTLLVSHDNAASVEQREPKPATFSLCEATAARQPLTQQQQKDVALLIADAFFEKRIAYQQLFVLADSAQEVSLLYLFYTFPAVGFTLADFQGFVRPMQLAAILAGMGVQGVSHDLLLRFFFLVAGDDGLICIHDL